MAAATVITVAFGGDDSPEPGVIVEWIRGESTPKPSATPLRTTVIPTDGPTPTPSGTPDPAADLDFDWPIVDACLPESDDLMPNAPRAYRNGTHEGVDFYDADNCAIIGVDTEALAVAAGRIVRADWDYQQLTFEELQELEQRATESPNDPAIEDVYRGRQVWIDHGGVVTRYAHLNGIAEGIDVGTVVERGQVVGYVGDSGSPESITDPGTQVHLHLEVRIGESYLGAGLPPDEVRRLYIEAFSGP
jgi:murein DD-endopeptidase MepM/ murein hydrolase activator NlpD